ncbi:MAG: hypothetical protein HFG68_14750 [Hungatella sp.]|nr:hypothetical protein [Hungatella sp.]
MRWDRRLKILFVVEILWGFVFMLSLGDIMVCQAEIRESSLREQKIRNTVGMTQGNEEDKDIQNLEDWEEEVSDEEIERILNEYLKNIDEGELQTESMTSSKVIDPVMEMKPEGQKKFRYTLPNGNYFISSIPNGMISAEAVDFELPEGTIGLVWKDDVSLAFPKSWHFTQKGNYHIRLLILQPLGDMTIDYNVYEVNFYFTIINRKDNTLGAVPAPNGFVITEARVDGKQQNIENKRCFFLKQDGYYEFEFESLEHEGLLLGTVFTRDTKAPFLSFSEEIKFEGVPGPVEFYPSEQGCEIYMNYNGSRGYAVSNSLTAAGSYELTVQDSVGNHRGYHIRIRQTYNLMDKRILLGILVLAAVAGVRLVFLRRNMKVL